MHNKHSIDKYFDPRHVGLIGNYVMPGQLDELGRPIGPEGWVDGGDTLHRAGFYASGLYYRRLMGATEEELKIYPYNTQLHYKMALIQLECPKKQGWYVRHPDPDFWYSKCHVNSRDQDSPNLIAMALHKMPRLWRYFKQHAKRLFLFTGNTRRNGATPENHGKKFSNSAEPLKWHHKLILKYRIPILPVPKGYRNYNWKMPDITFMGFWSYYIRGLYLQSNSRVLKWVLHKLLHIFDLDLLVNAYIKKYTQSSDFINHLNASAFAYFVAPTVVSRYVNKEINEAEEFKKVIKIYFNGRRSPGFIYDLWEPIIEEVMGG